MRCPHCGQRLPDGTQECDRCYADLSPAKRRAELLASVLVALVAIVCVALLTYVVLGWHEAQLLQR
ncbi:MAG: hypothetical protein Q4A01_08440 [Coriobacteriales bacterium]|nr:hypothetical protein [Coriobacteriales bacterium]